MREVLSFIGRFTDDGERTEVVDCFAYGCCYWFARILFLRFSPYYDASIMYDEVDNHWGCSIDERVYDITGDVTDRFEWEQWSFISSRDHLLYEHLVRDCIEMKEG